MGHPPIALLHLNLRKWYALIVRCYGEGKNPEEWATQFTLQPFDPAYSDAKRAGLLNAVFNPSSSNTPIYNLALYPHFNFQLAANFHNSTLNALRSTPPLKLPTGKAFSPCTPTNCNNDMWLQEWIQVFSFYNANKSGYSLITGIPTIVPNGGSKYAPQGSQ